MPRLRSWNWPVLDCPDFFRFPHTPHLAWLGDGSPRDNKVLSPTEAAELLQAPVVVEEKLDGANLGFSVGPDGAVRAQNRGQYLTEPYRGQFARLGDWLSRHEDQLFDGLGQHLMAFGEWCAAKHSLDYDCLPDWWLLFDIYDRQQGRFWSTQQRDAWAQQHGFVCVPHLQTGRTTLAHLQKMVLQEPSSFRSGPLEGLVVRADEAQWSLARAKLVRPDFTQAIDMHWRSRLLEWNVVVSNGV